MDQAALLTFWSNEIEGLSKTALRRHFTKLKNQKVDLATELSQGMLTVNMIVDIAKRIAKALLFLKEGKIAKMFAILFPKSPKELANDYLAWKYGLKPLIGDLQGAAEHLAEYIQRMAPFKSNGHAKQSFTREQTISLGAGSYIVITRTAEIRVKYGTSFVVPSNLVRQAASLGFTNPKNVIWELVPFSFVVDWFLPIGDFLSNLSALDGLVVKESYKTVTVHETYHRLSYLRYEDGAVPTEYPWVDLTGISDRGNGGYLQWRYFTALLVRDNFYCKREVIPLPDVPNPEFKNPLSKGHVESAIALFTQLISK
jgi:hypothetical protein